MSNSSAPIVYTYTDEAPALATFCLLPIIQRFAASAGVALESRDISLAGRILAQFPDYLSAATPDALTELGELAKTPSANIIKLPNISASIPQLQAAISELQAQGYALPDYPVKPQNAKEEDIKARYAKVLGSAVNPVLREGNSDRRAAAAVKEFAREHPHSMGAWSSSSKSRVMNMADGDFYGSEQSVTVPEATSVRIVFTPKGGSPSDLRPAVQLQAGEVIDSAVMSRSALCAFFEETIAAAKADGVLWSLHLKATMMKVSDPIMFGHAVRTYYAALFQRHSALLERIGANPNNGLGDVLAKIATLPEGERTAIEADLAVVHGERAPMAMVDSDRGITNLHVPSDIIIDASMPASIRGSGKMWGPDGKEHDAIYAIPDRCYAPVYQEVISHCKEHGAFDPTTMGSVPNVGLMAQKAEEYGSHDKTFEMPSDGVVQVIDATGAVLMEHGVAAGDIWRMCQTKDLPIRDWVRLAVERARATGAPAVFWLDANRAHDAQLIAKVERYLGDHNTTDLDIRVLAPVEAARLSCERARGGVDTISVTGNVLRDYLTDLFPILELGTSAKMLSIVPLLAGGGLYETGAGGSAPKHVQQFLKENHLRWDSLGEYLALAVSIEDWGRKSDSKRAQVLADGLNAAASRYLHENKGPSRKAGQLDNRGSHFYLALYWAEALSLQDDDTELKAEYAPIAKALQEQEETILAELSGVQGKPVDVGGYYHPDPAKARAAMLPSPTCNRVLGLSA
ncbi:MAG: NADP-dependent isocitrate dehydrogenase [Planctomycetota bacterium]|nr:MAG: NADP-dependent isocitrate dehydrogenase [Planctomycetota bacterium]